MDAVRVLVADVARIVRRPSRRATIPLQTRPHVRPDIVSIASTASLEEPVRIEEAEVEPQVTQDAGTDDTPSLPQILDDATPDEPTPIARTILVNGTYVEDNPESSEITCIACYSPVTILSRNDSTPPVPPFRSQPQASSSSPASDPVAEKTPAVHLPCPFAHVYCVPCLTTCIASRLEDGRNGRTVFPMRCPDCPVAYAWCYIDVNIASMVLTPAQLDDFMQQQYLEGIPKMYCPNRKCSQVVQLPESECSGNEAVCPACNTRVCVPCRTVAHPAMTCAAWMKSPSNLDPEEIHLRKLAKQHHWRRCTACRMIVERSEGCSHMTCRCGREFCHQCGADWVNGCSNPGDCSWKSDATLFIPGRFATLVRETVVRTQRSVSFAFKPNEGRNVEEAAPAGLAKRLLSVRLPGRSSSNTGACG